MSVRSLRAPLTIGALVVLVDQLTKRWALGALEDDHVIDVVGSLRFNLAFNKGMAFSQGTGLGPVIGVVALVVVVGLLVSIGRSTSRIYPLAVGLIVGGAVGNLLDRMFRAPGWLRGGVVDFIDVQWWPIFNVADIAVTTGGALLLISTMWPPPPPAPVAPDGSAGSVAPVEPGDPVPSADANADADPTDDVPAHDVPVEDDPADGSPARPVDERNGSER